MCTYYVVIDFWSENILTIPTIFTFDKHEIFNIIFWKYIL
jgi:hypothetical protein